MEPHNEAVASVARQISKFYAEKRPFRIYHGNTNSTRPSGHTHSNTVDTSMLNHVLSVDTSRKTCLVEPNVPMDLLVSETLKHGLIPPVVPEFPGITVGGGFSGTAGESSSFKHGFFHRAVNWIEIVLADGEVVIASEDERQDLLHGAAGTFGTLGVVTLFEMSLIEAKDFVDLAYFPVTSIVHAQEVIKKATADESTDFVDGIMFAPDRGTIMVGKMTNRSEAVQIPVVTFSKAWDEWFYLQAEKRMTEGVDGSPAHDLVPLTDYIFRYDRGAFWTGRYAYSWFWTPFNRMTRWLLDGFMHTRVMYHALHRSGMMQIFIIQDMAVPGNNAKEFSDWLDNELDIYPRWLCPLRQYEPISMHPHSSIETESHPEKGEPILNFGVWGHCPGDPIAVNRRIEAKLRSLQGMKWLYAQTFYTEEEFWQIYDKKWYEDLRRKYKAESLANVYDKVKPRLDPKKDITKGIWSVWPLAGIYGVLSTLKGGDYMRKG